MPKFLYKALKNDKEIVSDYVEAENPRDARLKIISKGFLPTEIYEESIGIKSGHDSVKKDENIKLSLSEKIAFTSELQNLLSASISVLEALDSVIKYSPSKKVKLVTKRIYDLIKNGATFSEALRVYSSTFGHVYVSICHAGESSGTLPEVLAYLLNLLKKQDSLKGKYIQMSIYPAILILMMVALYFIAGGVIFPRFVSLLQVDPTPLASLFIDGVSFFQRYWHVLIVLIGASVFALKSVFNFKVLTDKLSEICLQIPILGTCMQYFSLAHYSAVMHIAYDSGIPIIDAMKMAEQTISNHVLHEKAVSAAELVKQGKSISEAYESTELIPGILMSLIYTGEKTGKLGQMFRDASLAIEKKLDMALEAMSKAFEPAMIIVIGIFVLLFAVALIQMYAASLSALGGMF